MADAWHGQETFVVTTTDVVSKAMHASGRVYVVGECNHQHPIKVLRVLLKCLRIILKERPDVVISTGAAAGCIICFFSKLLRAKVIWLDSITNVQRLSLSGRMVRLIADLFLVQWPELAEEYKKSEYVGAVI